MQKIDSIVQQFTAVGSPTAGTQPPAGDAKLRETFKSFVGQTFYGQLIASMRKTVGKPAYFHGGRAEEVFQQQLDQVLTEHMTEASAETFSEPMYDLFRLQSR